MLKFRLRSQLFSLSFSAVTFSIKVNLVHRLMMPFNTSNNKNFVKNTRLQSTYD